MRLIRNSSIQRKLTIVIFCTSLLGLSVAGMAFEFYERASFRSALVSELEAHARTLGLNTAASLAFNDRNAAEELLASLRVESHIVESCLYDKGEHLFAGYRRNSAAPQCERTVTSIGGARFDSDSVIYSQDIFLSDEKTGAITILSDYSQLHTKMRRFREISAVILILSITATALAAFRLVRLITEPILQLATMAEKVSATEDYSLRAIRVGEDEVGRLVGSFNQMLEQIQERDAALQGINEELELRVQARTGELQQEINDRVQAENKLQASLKELKDLEAALDQHCIVARTDPQGIISYTNEKFCLISKFNREELIGKNHRIVNSGYHPKEFFEKMWRTIQSGQVWKGEIRNRAKDGSIYWADATIVPFCEADGRVRQYIAIRSDITERKRIEQDLRHAKEVAENANRAKSEFLANMSHEIRTPLNGVIGMTDLALDTELNPEQREYLETVKTSADSLLTVINDILDFSKIEAGKIDLEAVDFNLRDCLETALKTTALRADEKGLELLCEFSPEVPEVVRGDSSRLRQVVINLVGNAIKFTRQGEVAVRVKGHAQEGKDLLLHVTVSDTGIGIPTEKQESIFEPFTQADTSTTRKYGGTGLGLTISARLVEMMGGKIWVKSEVGRGSEFHFTMRFRAADRKPVEVGAMALPEILRGIKVLVVDDNQTNRRILVGMLQRWEMKPTPAGGGKEALAILSSAREAGNSYRLILTDMHMPNMDGFAFVERIRQRPEVCVATIMMLTSAGHRGDAARCKQLGVAAYLLKPIRQSELREAITRVLGAREEKGAIPLITRYSLQDARKPSDSLRILLAEDNLVNQRLATRLLEKRGHSVVVAGNGREAVAAHEKESFDLILMDVQMPEMDGLEATSAIREKENSSGKHLPIVALTAHAMKGDRERCMEAGMDEYLTKPIRPQELDEILKRFAARRAEMVHQWDGELNKR